ncbi:DUF3302 domain-containing protein [Urbifossiella limnaea]|uniref:Inner membrane protein YiaW n=1 Tax=Urbifossiella limnaea TaxID=2528023 RepID=A0A517XWU6_9BACT|nr:DUF3302 domain-containing protein [Urbifossiella limnaea]QDU21979.1 Inner membrane protein YiaW [Urbifossiella limnaea]
MFLDYLALALLLLSLTAVFYLFIYIHDLPHKIAEGRDHPHVEAIHVACWLSLITLHAMWPIVFIWAVSHKKGQPHLTLVSAGGTTDELARRLAVLEERLRNPDADPK